MHRSRMGWSRVGRLPDQHDRDVIDSEPKGSSDPVVPVKNAEVLIETEPERNEDAPNPDVFSQRGQVARGVYEGGTDEFAIHCAIPGNQCGGKPTDNGPHAVQVAVCCHGGSQGD